MGKTRKDRREQREPRLQRPPKLKEKEDARDWDEEADSRPDDWPPDEVEDDEDREG